jgi:hypothetical protein
MPKRGVRNVVGVAVLCVGLTAPGVGSQESPSPTSVDIPPTTTVLEGIPTVRIDSAEGTTTRRQLDQAEAARSLLRINVIDGQYYWTSRENRLLRLDTSGAFTYLSSEPGRYIRFTRVNNRIEYVEHVDVALGSVTWWGELRIK